MAAYGGWPYEGALKYGVDIHDWVVMTILVHLLATTHESDSISRLMQFLGRQYVRYFNCAYRRRGTLFEGRFKSCPAPSEIYLLTCLRYIELNPVRAGIVDDSVEHYWSSYPANAFGKPVKLWSPHPEYLNLGRESSIGQSRSRALFEVAIEREMVTNIR